VYLGSQIPDPTAATKEEGGKKLVVLPFFHKSLNYFIFELVKKKIGVLFTQRISPRQGFGSALI
jgi:hypothetical protein